MYGQKLTFQSFLLGSLGSRGEKKKRQKKRGKKILFFFRKKRAHTHTDPTTKKRALKAGIKIMPFRKKRGKKKLN